MAKFCPNCGKEYEGEPNFCPACGEKINLGSVDSQIQISEKKNKPVNVGCGCLLSIIIFVILSNIFSSSDTNNVTDVLSGSDALKVVNYKSCRGEYGTKMVCGTVKNESDKTFSYAQVEINLYDKAGNLVGSTLSNINNFEPRTNWKFEAPVIENNVASFKIKDVTGY